MNRLVTRVLPVAAVCAALVGGGAGFLADADAGRGLTAASADVRVLPSGGLTLSGDGGTAAPRFDLRRLAPGEGRTLVFVVTRGGPSAPALLRLDAAGLVPDEGVCVEPEEAVDAGCGAGQSAELADQLRVAVQHGPHDDATGCGPLGDPFPVRERSLSELTREPLLVRALTGVGPQERVCVAVTVALADRRDNNAVQGERVAFDLRFTASTP